MANFTNITGIQSYFVLPDAAVGGWITYTVMLLLTAILFDNMDGDATTKMIYTSMVMSVVSMMWYVVGFTNNYSLWQVYVIFASASFVLKALFKW